jgi:hypothetical protein
MLRGKNRLLHYLHLWCLGVVCDLCNGIYCQAVLEFLASSYMARLVSLRDITVKSDMCIVNLMQDPALETYESDLTQRQQHYLKARQVPIFTAHIFCSINIYTRTSRAQPLPLRYLESLQLVVCYATNLLLLL